MAALELKTTVPGNPLGGQAPGERRGTGLIDATRHAEAAERVATYFRTLGVADEATLRRATAQVLAGLEQQQPGLSAEELPQRAVTAAVGFVEAWLDEITRPEDEQSCPAARGLIMWRMRRVIADHPEYFLTSNDSLRALLLTREPVLPEEQPATMAPQQFGELPAVLHSAYWQRLGRGCRQLWRRTLARLGGG